MKRTYCDEGSDSSTAARRYGFPGARLALYLLLLLFASFASACNWRRPTPRTDTIDSVDAAPSDEPYFAPYYGQCPLAGCTSFAAITVHLNEPYATLLHGATFRACHQDQCWDGSFGPLGTCGASGASILAVNCGLQLESPETTAVVSVGLAADAPRHRGALAFHDGDRVSLRIVAGDGRVLADVERAATYVDRFPNGRLCKPMCRQARVELWPRADGGWGDAPDPNVPDATPPR